MRDKQRIKEFTDKLAEIWEDNVPDWRFGQLMYNFFADNGDPFFWEEDEFLKRLENWLEF